LRGPLPSQSCFSLTNQQYPVMGTLVGPLVALPHQPQLPQIRGSIGSRRDFKRLPARFPAPQLGESNVVLHLPAQARQPPSDYPLVAGSLCADRLSLFQILGLGISLLLGLVLLSDIRYGRAGLYRLVLGARCR
jgi:hypothetical protein